MPLYEYRCTSCDYKFEKIQKFSDAPEEVCPKCGGQLVRPMTAPALKFEGAGWYINDYSAKGSASSSSSETKGEKSESKGSDKDAGKGSDKGSTPAAASSTSTASSSSASTSGGSGTSSSGSSTTAS